MTNDPFLQLLPVDQSTENSVPMHASKRSLRSGTLRIEMRDFIRGKFTRVDLHPSGWVKCLERGGDGILTAKTKFYANGQPAMESYEKGGFQKWSEDGAIHRDFRSSSFSDENPPLPSVKKVIVGGLVVSFQFADGSTERFTLDENHTLITWRRKSNNGVIEECGFWSNGMVASIDHIIEEQSTKSEVMKVRHVFDLNGKQVFREYIDFLGNHKRESWIDGDDQHTVVCERHGTSLRRQARVLRNGAQIHEHALGRMYHKARYHANGSATVLDQDIQAEFTRLVEFDPEHGITVTENSPCKFEQWTWQMNEPGTPGVHVVIDKSHADATTMASIEHNMAAARALQDDSRRSHAIAD